MKAFASVLVLAMVAGSSQAITISSRPIGSDAGYQSRAVTQIYNGQAGPYSAFAAAGGAIGFDDYTSTASGASTTLASLVFVGGVTNAGETISFQFFNPDNSLAADSGSLALPQGGNFIWTITFGNLPDGSDSTFQIPTAGILQLTVGTGTGRWFLTATPPTIGSNNPTFGGGSQTSVPFNAFSLNAVPAPSSLALLGLGGLVAGRRRR
ncbi:MAG: PEP-CTERM sorting domain-containing protein [Tepidisphaera sp.]|nr:PEP-CTERM sorting domain-containing protein [Tepidisphaera sp.]